MRPGTSPAWHADCCLPVVLVSGTREAVAEWCCGDGPEDSKRDGHGLHQHLTESKVASKSSANGLGKFEKLLIHAQASVNKVALSSLRR